MVHIAHYDLELVIGILAGNQQAFQHFGQHCNRRLKIGETLGRVLVHGNVDQRHQRQSQLARVKQGPVGHDQPRFF